MAPHTISHYCMEQEFSMQKEILQKLHDGHQGIQRCRLRAKTSVWWPGISKQINDVTEQCSICVRDSSPRREPLIPSKLPDHLWQKIGTDLFYLKKSNYILIIDYFSRFIEVIKLKSTTSRELYNLFSPATVYLKP